MLADRDRWILASASPRRRELLARAGQSFEVEPSGFEEDARRSGESAREFALRLARSKGEDVARRRRDRWILAADTIVVAGDHVLGKPRDDREARAMLASLSDREHRVISAFVLLDREGRVFASDAIETTVVFRALSVEEIAAYVATGEARDKAGAYAIQGGAGEFVRSVAGSYSNVVGLPLEAVERALREAGIWRGKTGEEPARA